MNSWCQHQHPPHHTPTTFRNVKLNPGYLSYRLGPRMKYMKYILWKYLYVVSAVVSSCIIKVLTTGFLSAEVSEDKVVFVIIRMQISRITFRNWIPRIPVDVMRNVEFRRFEDSAFDWKSLTSDRMKLLELSIILKHGYWKLEIGGENKSFEISRHCLSLYFDKSLLK